MFLSGMGTGRPQRRLATLALLAAISVSAATAEGSCKTRVVRDYTGFIDALPPLPGPPVGERLSFAPERVFFRGPSGGQLQAGAGARRYTLSYSPYDAGSGEPTPPLDWRLTAVLTPIDRLGRQLAPPQTSELHVERLWPSGAGGANVVGVGFDIAGDPAIYRLELVIENGSGEQLAAFGEYFRVAEPSIDLRPSLNRRSFRPGQRLRATLSNYGVAWYGYGYPWGVEYKRNDSWVPSPVDFTPGAFLLPLLTLQPGESTSCWSARVPLGAPPGKYRFLTSVSRLGTPAPPRSRSRRLIRLGFTVLPRRDFGANTAAGRRTSRRAP